MSSKDKTREKLMGSMRKTKSDAGIGTDKQSAAATSREASAQKPVKLAGKKRSTASASTTQHTDAYQSGRRVWPD